MSEKICVMLTFREGSEGSGPFNSHMRIIDSELSNKYEFHKLMLPRGRLGIFNINLLRKLIVTIKEKRPDLVHFSGLQLEGFYVSLACKILSVRSVCAIRGSSLEAQDIGLFKKGVLSLYELFTLLLSSAVYANSLYVGGWSRLKFIKDRYYGVIYNFPPKEDTDIKTYIDFNLRKKLNINDQAIIIIYTGRVTVDKGSDVIIELIKRRMFSDNVHLVILGEGAELQSVISCASDNNYTGNVHCLGYTGNVSSYLRNSNIFISCSKHETLGNSIIEAGLNCLPIVAKKTGGIPEIVENEKSGFLVENGDVSEYELALKKLIESSELRNKMGVKSYEVVSSRFDRDEICRQLDILYENGKS